MQHSAESTRRLPAPVVAVITACVAFVLTVATTPWLLAIAPVANAAANDNPFAVVNRHLAVRNWIAQPILAIACGLGAGYLSRTPAWLLGLSIAVGLNIISLVAVPARLYAWGFFALYVTVGAVAAAAATRWRQ
jgi:hypothetical protein